MNRNNIIEFLEIYKNLDELCRQILSSDRGVSEYIDEMSNESQGWRIAGWDRDYKQLKRMRWIRNRLVHEAGSFDDSLVNVKDIEWLHTFYRRIMECTDPFSLLHQSVNMYRKPSRQGRHSENYFPTNQTSISQNEDLPKIVIILAGLSFIGVILLAIFLFGLISCF